MKHFQPGTKPARHIRVKAWLVFPSLILLVLAVGCRTPVGADKTSVSRVYAQLHHSALEGGAYSDTTRAVLRRYGLEKPFRSRPEKTLQELHNKTLTDRRLDLLLALGELNYYHAERLRRSVKPGESGKARDFFLAASLYAYWFWFDETANPEGNSCGPRLEFARGCYNRALAQAFLAPKTTNGIVRIAGGLRHLSVGPVLVRMGTNALPWSLNHFSEFVMADAYTVRGLSVRNRQPGLGAPLIATATRQTGDFEPPRLPVTLFLRVEGEPKDWKTGRLKLALELYPGYPDAHVKVDGHFVLLETDMTAPLAYALNDPELRKLGRRQFYNAHEIVKSGIYRLQPYEPGAVPVVFVHGTFSSPVCWAEMWNTLESDPVLSRRCQCWAYVYNSGNPVAWSAANLRDALTDTVNELDPNGTDPALRQIVVIGHSQGGLLAKLTVVRTGDKLWRQISDKKLDDLPFSEKDRAELRRMFFVKPVPYVKSVIFIATPHRGSFRSTGLTRRLAALVVSLPGDMMSFIHEAARQGLSGHLPSSLVKRIPTSLDGMSPKSPVLLALAEMPPVTGVTCHSIIAVKGDGPFATGNDGVITYQSAHISYARSELVVRAAHSCEREPAVIEEVRRILLKHLAEIDRHPP